MGQALTESIPDRGEIWLVRLSREVEGQHLGDCPNVVVSSPAFNKLPIRIVVPLIFWRTEFSGKFNILRIKKSSLNSLSAESAVDFLQVHSLSTKLFVRQIGTLEAEHVAEIVAGLVIAIDYTP